jgi:hypothetical protein
LTFDVGTTNGYSPVAVDATAITGTPAFTVKATQGAAPYVSGTNKLARYWTLTSPGTLTANLTFTYLAGDVTGTVGNYQFIKNSGGSVTTLAPSGTPTTTSAAINSVSSFSDWTLAEPAAVLPGSLQFSAANYNDNETNADHSATITVTRTGGSDGSVSVQYATSNGTATLADNDYLAASGTLNWASADSASKTFTVTVKGDTTFEPDETVNLTLSAATGGAAITGTNPATLTITNDDAPPDAIFNSSGNLAAGTYTNVTVNSPAVVTVTGNVVVVGCVNVNSGGTLNMGGFTFSGAFRRHARYRLGRRHYGIGSER